MKRELPQFSIPLAVSLLFSTLSAQGLDYSPKIDYLNSPFFYTRSHKFRFWKYTPRIPKKFVGKVVDSGKGLYTLYSMLGGLYHLNSALLSLLYRYNRLATTPKFKEEENFLAYLELKIFTGLQNIRYFKNRKAIWQNSLYLVGEDLKLYKWGIRLLTRKKVKEGLEVAVGLCRRELYWLRILASSKICSCSDFLIEVYNHLWYKCKNLEKGVR